MISVKPLVRWEPSHWYVFFSEKQDRRWLNRLSWGRFKHVSAMGFVPVANVWLIVDPWFGRLYVEAVPDGPVAEIRLARQLESSVTVKMVRGFGDVPRVRPMFSCVAVVAHLLGLRSGALRPDTLFRHCVREGGEVLIDGRDETEEGATDAG
jgi:hypothetical protein